MFGHSDIRHSKLIRHSNFVIRIFLFHPLEFPPMAKRERSAGVILFRNRAAAREYLLLDYGRHWDFAKGHVEKGEDVVQAALRELKEETGISDARLTPGFSHEIEYYFRNNRKDLVHKTVWFCLAETRANTVRLSDEHVGYEFLPFEPAIKRLTYAGAKEILRHAEKYLAENNAK
jgi:bis(5'-nucleosidyl)-tetraphosphatase